MREGERDGACRIKIEMQALIDRNFQCGGAWAAAKCQNRGETRHAEHEDKADHAWKAAPDNGPFYQLETGAASHAKLGCKLPVIVGNGFIGCQKKAYGKRHVEKNMGDQNTGDAVDVGLHGVAQHV
ncbi:hypothetical protein BR141012304_10949 [Brucella inopinata]|nr:hypothetical protein BR141012304_10949 [Brucella inopinata]